MGTDILLLLMLCANAFAFKTAEEIAKEDNSELITPISNTSSLQKLSKKIAKCIKDEIICDSDRLLYCGANGETITMPCPNSPKGKGHCNCDGNDCTTEAPVNCNKPPTSPCTNPGVKLPVAYDCRRYTYCDPDIYSPGKSGTELTYQCATGLTYSPRHLTCKQGIPCDTPVCPNTSTSSLVLVPFPHWPEYYLFCENAKVLYIKKCEQEGYAAEAKKCVFQCTESGQFQDPNPSRCEQGYHYSCVQDNLNGFTRTEHKCDPNYTFNSDISVCTRGSNCKSVSGAGGCCGV